VLPGFTVNADNCAAVATLVRALDGIPLAIELAAVRLRALSLDQIVARLADRYRLLTTGSRSAPPRQQTLRALIDWSYELCSPAERTVWARLAVFSGGFELDAAEAVCSGDGIAPDSVFDLVASLVDKSIIMRDEHEGGVRYRLLETIREYGEEKLRDDGAEMALRRRHRDWYADFVGLADLRWFSADQPEWIRRLRHEHPNLRVALELSVAEEGDAEAGLRMAASLENYWFVRGFLGEGRHWLDRALVHESGVHRARAKALRVGGWLAVLQGDRERAVELLDQARELAEHLFDRAELAYITQVEGNIALFDGDLATASALFEEALEGFREVGGRSGEMWALFVLGLTQGLSGNPQGGEALLEECVEATSARGEYWWRSYALWALGLLRWRAGDTAGAAAIQKDSLQLKQLLEEQLGLALCLEALAWIAGTERRDERSARLLGAAERVWRDMQMSLTVFRGLSAFRDECTDQVKGRIGGAAFDAAFRHGGRLTAAEALELALEEKPAAAAGPTRSVTPLTRREREIAELVAEGLSNREIAATLVIAQRTAEGHVEHILSKLGFTSRAQVAAWVAEQRGQQDGPSAAG
jgi:non-specific serine/threonine protein kinase